MKYSRLSTRMVPSSLQDWLEEELENRGIDGVVYTRYILSLLQDDESNDEIHVNSGLCESTLEANPNFINCCVNHNKRHHKCHSNKWMHRRYQQSNSVNGSWQKNKSLKCCECAYEECTRLTNIDQKRSVVVECLKSASEQDFEIESLVDELCAKLEEYKSNMGRNQIDPHKVDSRSRDVCHEFDSSPKEQANRYFAAFPALNKLNVVDSVEQVTEVPVEATQFKKITSNEFASLENRSRWDGRRIIEFAKKDPSLDTSDTSVDEELGESRHSRQMSTFGLAQKIRNPIEDITNVYNDSNIVCKVASCSVDNIANVDMRLANTDRFTHSENLFPNVVEFGDNEEIKSSFDDEIAFSDEWEHEKVKVLVAKFNNKIASLWNDEKGGRNERKSIWCFDNTNWSPQSSNTPSPKLNECFNNKWFSIAPFDHSSTLWEPLQKHAVSYSIATANDRDIEDRFSVEREKNSPKVLHENKTSLSNHGDDSLFVEVPSRKNGSFSEHCAPEVQQATNDCYLAVQEQKIEDDETAECLLTSPKTHFQPIKQDSFDEEYEDATTIEADAEVSRLVPCSSICPNNANNDLKCDTKSQSSQESKNRSLSTSLPELTLFMGPFTDNELEEEKLSIEDERHSSKACVDENEQRKVTSLSSHEENEFEELCTMLNEVLREDTGNKEFVDSDDVWFDKEQLAISAEQRSSWSAFWGAYKNDVDLDSSHREFFVADEVQQASDFLADAGARSNDVENITAFSVVDCECETLEDDKPLEWFKEDREKYLPLRNDAYNASVEWSAGIEYEYPNTISEDCADPSEVFCCWNLEKEWQEEEREDCGVPQQRRGIEEWNGKRPCTFFMEGNCRRSDCKFSHDLRSITCKFWEEGCCFKGILCPFLHGYPSESKNGKVNASNPKFLIESETDFPSLSTGNSEAYMSESSESNISPAKSNAKRFKQESNVLYRMVKKKRKKAGNQCYNEKAV